MGTNYYFVLKRNKKAELEAKISPIERIFIPIEENPLHIGKSSCGWTFSFQKTQYYSSYKEILEFYEKNKENIKIIDEYNKTIPIDEFMELVEYKKEEPNNHYYYMHEEYPDDDFGDYLDDEGNSFSELDFG